MRFLMPINIKLTQMTRFKEQHKLIIPFDLCNEFNKKKQRNMQIDFHEQWLQLRASFLQRFVIYFVVFFLS